MTTSSELIEAAAAAYTGLPITLDKQRGKQDRGFSYADDASGLAVSGHFRVQGSAVKLTSITVTAADGADLAAATIRNLPYGRITSSLAALVAREIAGRSGLSAAYPDAAATAAAHRLMSKARRGGPPALTDERLWRIAEAYLRETAPGSAPGAVKRLAVELKAPEDTVRTWLARCRKDGWLTASVKGRAGGEPGPRLLMARMQQGDGS